MFAVDLHIHSRFSRATSKSLTLPELFHSARAKGISVLGTGDFTHPAWRREMHEQLQDDGSGLLRLKKEFQAVSSVGQTELFSGSGGIGLSGQSFVVDDVRFILTCELSTIYSHNGRTRKVHHVFLAPDLRRADAVSEALQARGINITSDGRPMMGLTSQELCEVVFTACPDCQLIPAHIWTPWFSVFGSRSGYDTIEECYGPYTEKILALETGLSSDPEMNWRCSQLDRFTLVSNSDAHSAVKLARECNVFAASALSDLTYGRLVEMIRKGDPAEFLFTAEFYPEEGKYHYDGHRVCEVCWSPEETRKHGGICPRCHQGVTVGVSSRVDELSDRPVGYVPSNRPGVRHIVPLDELIASEFHMSATSKKTAALRRALTEEYGSELRVLLDADTDEISAFAGVNMGSAIRKMRSGEVEKSPGYDGEFGKVIVSV
ncbi:hypothetical protein AUK40_04560 [Candidatus Wirthbacteria bacterium CG2_30_54_11]|uniref:DNA helicase UvrD n=1 Tax=Candidatus Wirthbacteria bacterium CG2_30_54_11 TaxID=1817892 RepID=A0A1J5IU89_9BACT|nr:MAG: hypothetical protein AUK40_04560 [Candidatus Wirthbacteria bacterium CG2_30_54_11]